MYIRKPLVVPSREREKCLPYRSTFGAYTDDQMAMILIEGDKVHRHVICDLGERHVGECLNPIQPTWTSSAGHKSMAGCCNVNIESEQALMND